MWQSIVWSSINEKQTRSNTSIDFIRRDTECGRGVVKDNALKAVVTSTLFRCRVEKAKKGKGSYSRKMKYKGKEPYANLTDFVVFA